MPEKDLAQTWLPYRYFREICLCFLVNLFVCSGQVRYYAGAVNFAAWL
jgi:hypothetical protein